MMTATSQFKTIRKTLAYEAISDQIKEMINAGQLRPGDRLPPERELAQLLNVGRPTLREAFRVLEHTGLVESRMGQGRFVVNLEPSVPGSAATAEALEEALILDFLQVRRLLDVPMAGLAAERATPEDFGRLEGILSVPIGQNEDLDSSFHLALADATHSITYRKFVSSEIFLLYRMALKTAMQPLRRSDTEAEHREILDAIRLRDKGGAEAAMARHLDNAELNVRQALYKEPSKPQSSRST